MPEQEKLILTAAEEKIINVLRKTTYGEVTVRVKDSKPVFVEVKKTYKLD